MGFRDLREFIAKIEAEGELRRVKAKVDWDGELPAIVGKMYARRGPALLFENIKGYEKTWCRRLLAGGLSARSRAAIMMGMPKDTSAAELIKLLRRRFREPVAPVEAGGGPVKENILKGDAIDLFQIPVPKWHPLDGGRYINTWCGVVTMDPDTREHNVGMYRGMLLDRNRIGVMLIPAQGWGAHYARYQERNEPMPVAMVYGWDPTLGFMAAAPVMSMTEYEAMGSIRQEPVPLVRCETSDLRVPASAEIVVEGTISPDPETYEMEGPFGEWTGYYGQARLRPVFQVSCITHRDDPVFRGNLEGLKPGLVNEDAICAYLAMSSLMWNMLEDQGIPGILDVVPAPWTLVRIHKTYQGQARQIAAALWGSRLSVNFCKTVMVVDEEVDIHNMRASQLAVQTYVDPQEDIIVYPGHLGSSLDVALAQNDRDEFRYGAGLQNKVLIDATINWTRHPVRKDWGGRRLPPTCTEPDPETARLVESRWNEYGL